MVDSGRHSASRGKRRGRQGGHRHGAVNLQLVAATVLHGVIDEGRSLDRALEIEAEKLPEERLSQLRELSFGGCRHFVMLDGLLRLLMSKPIRARERIVHFLLVVGLYQLEHQRTPDHAAVDETVAALSGGRLSWARGLVNGVLREFIRKRDSGELASLREQLSPEVQSGFGPFLYEAITRSWPDYASQVFAASIARPPLTLRINRARTDRDTYLELLSQAGIEATATAHSPDGVTVDKPVAVTGLPMFGEGWASVQDESAQLCTAQMQLQPSLTVLDGCAAPGGKTCAMLEAVPSITLTAVDLPARIQPVRDNLKRLGLEAEIQESSLHEHGAWSDDRQWQRVLLDVPCSGSGVIRRHPDILHRRVEGDLEQFAEQQLALLQTAWVLLARGGMLLYVTCSVMREENEDVIAQFLAQRQDAEVRPIEDLEGIDCRYGRQRLPGVHPGDGFYYCRLGKL